MSTKEERNSIQRTARLAGFLYLLVSLLAIFGILYVPSKLIVPGDAATTADNLLTSESLFRLAIASGLLASIGMALVVLVLYQLLKPVNRTASRLMVVFVLLAVPIDMLNRSNQLAALLLLSSADDLTLFTTGQLQALAFQFLRFHEQGNSIAFIFWGLWLLPLGYLVFKSGFFPRILGILLMIAGVGYFTDSFTVFLGYEPTLGMITCWGEVLFLLWLLIKGVNVEQWEKRALGSS